MVEIKNKTIFTGDNLGILRGMNDESIDLIYLDPPFNSNKHYSAPVGSRAAEAHFKDVWTLSDVDEASLELLGKKGTPLNSIIEAIGLVGGKGDKSYLIYMAVRLLEMLRILKPHGSLYMHCDNTMSHSLKMVLDVVFGKKNFHNEFIWYYSGGGASTKNWAKKHDCILFYSKTNKWYFDADSVRVPHKWNKGQLRADGSKRNKKGKIADDVWQHHAIMPWSEERTGYPTQKPLALLERLILASCPKNGIVLDPFCGCATTCVAAERLNRQWIGIDISPQAVKLLKKRIDDTWAGLENQHHQEQLFPIISRTDIPVRNAPPRSKGIKTTLYGKQRGDCLGCREHFRLSNLTIDHIVPTSKGGPDSNGNIQLLCHYCNSVKGDRSMAYLISEINKREK